MGTALQSQGGQDAPGAGAQTKAVQARCAQMLGLQGSTHKSTWRQKRGCSAAHSPARAQTGSAGKPQALSTSTHRVQLGPQCPSKSLFFIIKPLGTPLPSGKGLVQEQDASQGTMQL